MQSSLMLSAGDRSDVIRKMMKTSTIEAKTQLSQVVDCLYVEGLPSDIRTPSEDMSDSYSEPLQDPFLQPISFDGGDIELNSGSMDCFGMQFLNTNMLQTF
eukprot:TRINITY_DN19803_c0_g1_i1.p1 TRINITY_DN19803_c0_g1~~TRINITY_DN19803_c0_g1_i1.p1  ORF type:complete len:101 (-),score=17.94 TRINITY_DN19803_c0_g1_i1:79-381(-)